MNTLREVAELSARSPKLPFDLGELFPGTLVCALVCPCEQRFHADESLLCALAQFSFQATPLRIGGLDDPPTRGGELDDSCAYLRL
jgi:hypothetical protein